MSRNTLGLTDHQCDVLRAMCRLGCPKLVAAELGLSDRRPVDEVLRTAQRRMGARTRVLALLQFDRQMRVKPETLRSSVFTLPETERSTPCN